MNNDTVTNATTEAGAGFAAASLANAKLAVPFAIDTARGPQRPFIFTPTGAQLTDLSGYLAQPQLLTQTAKFVRPTAFAAYLNLFGQKDRSIVFADRAALTFKAVLDYHAAPDQPSWNGHVATFTLEQTDDWAEWMAQDRKPQDQVSFAVFLEEHAHNIVEPDAALFTEMALNFGAKKDTKFKSHRRLQDGSVNFVFSETLTSGAEQPGALTVPEKFTLAIAIFEGTQPIEVKARLRYRITGGDLKLSYEIITPEKLIDAVFEQYEDVIAKATPDHVRAVIHGSV